MPAEKFPRQASTYRGHWAEIHLVRYQADTSWYSPVEGQPWASYVHNISCEHAHRTPEGAARCGDQQGKAAAAAYQARVEQDYPKLPCSVEIAEDPTMYETAGADRRPGFLKFCRAHSSSAVTWHRSALEAERDGWACPWAPFVKA